MNITGDYDNNVLYGTEYDDVIDGALGNDVLIGRSGNDTFLVKGGQGPDHYDGGSGYDKISIEQVPLYYNYIWLEIASMEGVELIDNKSQLAAYIVTDNNLNLNGTELRGINDIRGMAGTQYIKGSRKNDIIKGLDGDDFLEGYIGNDTLYGDNGADEIVGGRGNDALYGGAGADKFVFDTGHGSDIIYDFEDGVDKILFPAELSYSFAASGNGTLVTAGATSILLSGVFSALISADDFGTTPYNIYG
ncbi:calcium-binding protein [Methylobacterium platani]|uniref:calcium-binding protein n=1 Tax=Methylobacterium platani TaxID=427683 RepID=UPI0009E55152|nr:calcium-binding protein [Methylobacterium platani]